MFDFPTSPPIGASVTTPDGAVRYWDGQKWDASPSGGSSPGPRDASNDVSTAQNAAIARTLANRFADRYSVEDWLTPGQPDGTTDNSAQLQAAINAAAGNAQLLFPAASHSYVVGPSSSLFIPSNSHIIIEPGATLQIANGANCSCLCIATGASNILIELYGTLDGNKANNAAVSGGIVKQSGSVPTSNIYVRGNRQGLIKNCFNWGINISCCTNGEVSGVTVDGCGNSTEFNGYSPSLASSTITGGGYVAAAGVITITTAAAHGLTTGSVFTIVGVSVSSGHPTVPFLNLAYTAASGTGGTTIVSVPLIVAGQGDMVFTGGATSTLSGSYTSATGNSTITTILPHGLTAGAVFTLSSVKGTGNPQAMGGQFTATSGTSGAVINYINPVTGLGDTTFTTGVLTTCIPSINVGFSDCTVRNISDLGLILFGGVQNGFIRNCDVSACAGGGAMIFADPSQRGINSDCEIAGCTLWNNTGYGVYIGANIIGVYQQDTVVRGNRIFGNHGCGIMVTIADGVLIEGNSIHENVYIANFLPSLNMTGEITLFNSTNRVSIVGNTIFNPNVGCTDGRGFGIAFDRSEFLYIEGNRIGDYQSVPSMTAALGGNWGATGLSDGNYYGPRIASAGNFPADASVYEFASGQGVNYDMVTGYVSGTLPVNQITGDTNFPPAGLTVGWNYSGTRGEVNFLVGESSSGAVVPGGFDFRQVKSAGAIVTAGTYNPATGAVSLTTSTPHLVAVGGSFTVTGGQGTGADIYSLQGRFAATAGTAGTTLNYTIPAAQAILTITHAIINATQLDGGVIDSSAGSGGVLFSVDGHGNAAIPGSLTMASGPTIRAGTGAATGTQPKGSLWMRTDGTVGSTFYVSQGAGTWNAVAAV